MKYILILIIILVGCNNQNKQWKEGDKLTVSLDNAGVLELATPTTPEDEIIGMVVYSKIDSSFTRFPGKPMDLIIFPVYSDSGYITTRGIIRGINTEGVIE